MILSRDMEIMKFAQESQDLVKLFSDYYNQAMTEKGKKGLIYNTSTSKDDKALALTKCFAEELEKRSKISIEKDCFNSMERFAQHSTVQSFADMIVGYLIDMTLPDIRDSAIGQIAEFKFVGLGDTLNFKVKNNSLFSVSRAGRRQRHTPAQRVENGNVTVTPINHSITVYSTLIDMLTGRDSLAEFVMKAIASIQAQMIYETYDTFSNHMNSLTVPSGLKLTSFAETPALELCAKVGAWNNETPIILGTPIALKSVLPSASGLNINLTDIYVTQGYLPMFGGKYRLVPLDQIADLAQASTFGTKIADDRLYIVSPSYAKMVKVGVEGVARTVTDGQNDTADGSIATTINKAFGTGIVTNTIAGIIEL